MANDKMTMNTSSWDDASCNNKDAACSYLPVSLRIVITYLPVMWPDVLGRIMTLP